ncbi:MAG TPA: transcription termination/antitermination NusG family protein [Flavisolibacter sp.]|nr:transcription termination/antitermination NusG family protein [Flavisolibacter sp.]
MSNWSVIKTRSRWEKKVARLLKQKGIDTFCPLLKAKHQWSDRVKTIEKPLLKSYVFVKVAEEQRTVVRLTEGVVNFVYRNGKPVVVKERVIQSIRQFQLSHPAVEVMDPAKAENGVVPAQPAKGPAARLLIEGLNLLLVPRLSQSKLIEATTDKT